jgi:DNA-binding GntR family transcriptional regulator
MKALAKSPMMSQLAVTAIRRAILNGSLAPESRIRQEELAATLGVSREPVRQALLLLKTERLVCVRNGSVIVAPLDQRLIADVYELREVIEGYVAYKVAERQDFDAKTLGEICKEGRNSVATSPTEKLIELDQAFHDELYRACGNQVVIELMQTQWSHISRALRAAVSPKSFRKQSWDEHAAIVAAIVKHQKVHARSLAAAHMRSALQRKQTGVKSNLNASRPVRRAVAGGKPGMHHDDVLEADGEVWPGVREGAQ